MAPYEDATTVRIFVDMDQSFTSLQLLFVMNIDPWQSYDCTNKRALHNYDTYTEPHIYVHPLIYSRVRSARIRTDLKSRVVLIRFSNFENFKILVHDSCVCYWIGLSEQIIHHQRKYIWTNGAEAKFTDWNRFEPSRSGGREHCVHLWGAYLWNWNDKECESQFSQICESKNNPFSNKYIYEPKTD